MKYQRGFTLIEMLIAMAIFSSLMAILMLGYQQGLNLWQKSQHQSKQWQRMELRYHLLDTLFAQSVVADYTYTAGLSAPYFFGDKTSMRLMTASPMLDMPGHVRPVAFRAVNHDGTWAIEYREGNRYGDPGRGIIWPDSWIPLMEGLSSVELSFQAPSNPAPASIARKDMSEEEKLRYRNEPEWMVAYDSYKLWRMPRRVSIRFSDRNHMKHEWLFALPQVANAWPMTAYELETL